MADKYAAKEAAEKAALLGKDEMAPSHTTGKEEA